MDTSKLKEGETSVRIVPGKNGISFGSGNQVKFMGAESTHKANVRDVSFSLYLSSASMEGGGDISRPAFAKGLEKQNSSRGRVPVLGRATMDCEISIFDAEKYFSAPEEKKINATHESKNDQSSNLFNSKANIHASKNKVLLSTPDLYDSRNPMPSPASSIVAVNRSFRPGPGSTSTPTASSQASCNSQSALLSMARGNSVRKLDANNGKNSSAKWAFGCPCPCSNKKSVDIDEPPTEKRRAPSVTSTALMDSPLSSIRYSYPSLGKRVLSRSIDKQRSGGFVDTAPEVSDINRGVLPAINSVHDIAQSRLSKDTEQLQALRSNFNGQENFRSRINLEKEDGFSFSIPPVKSEENPRPSLEVFGSPFSATVDNKQTRNSTSGMVMPQMMQPSDLHRRTSVLLSLDQARKSFAFNSNSEAHRKFRGNDNDEDKESDSSSDLFEIESFTTQGTACYPLRRRDSVDDTSSIQSGLFGSSCCEALGFQNSFHFGLEAVTPSAQSSYYEPSEASLDWSVTSGDTVGNFSLDYEEMKIMKRRASLRTSDLSRLREASLKGSSQRRSSGGSFLGCSNAKAVNVAAPTQYSQSTRYSGYGV